MKQILTKVKLNKSLLDDICIYYNQQYDLYDNEVVEWLIENFPSSIDIIGKRFKLSTYIKNKYKDIIDSKEIGLL